VYILNTSFELLRTNTECAPTLFPTQTKQSSWLPVTCFPASWEGEQILK
jgi:hypothetical protein